MLPKQTAPFWSSREQPIWTPTRYLPPILVPRVPDASSDGTVIPIRPRVRRHPWDQCKKIQSHGVGKPPDFCAWKPDFFLRPLGNSSTARESEAMNPRWRPWDSVETDGRHPDPVDGPPGPYPVVFLCSSSSVKQGTLVWVSLVGA